jgi:hypothetical protein
VGSQEHYLFNWGGGAFSATASITGASDLASYLFTEGGATTCNGGASQTLNIGDSFTSTIAIANLSAGQYCIGIDANSAFDPNFLLKFNTPVSGAPEPSTLVLLSAGFGVIVLRNVRRRRQRS